MLRHQLETELSGPGVGYSVGCHRREWRVGGAREEGGCGPCPSLRCEQ